MRRVAGAATLLVSLIFALTLVSAAPQPSGRGYGNAGAITVDELGTYLHFLASDQLEGRNAPSRGYDTAALYIASHLKEWGIRPLGSTSGTTGPLQPYLMPIELVSAQPDPAGMRLAVNASAVMGRGGFGGPAGPAGPRSFEYSTEWALGNAGFGQAFGGGRGGGGGAAGTVTITGAQLVFVGNGFLINKTNADPYRGLDVKGKVLVVAGMPAELAGLQTAGRGGRAAANPLGVENVDFMTPQDYGAKNGALAVVRIASFQQLTAMTAPPASRGAGPNGPSFQVVKFQSGQPAPLPTIVAGVALTSALFQGERLGGAQVFEGAAANAKLESFPLNPDKRLTLQTAVTTTKGSTENVIGMVEGRDPVLKKEFVVFSAHLDHVGRSLADASGDAINNGADDDGSGSAALMAIARAYALGAAKGMQPRRSVIFLWVTGEEKGLWGSQYFNEFPPVDITKVAADLNMDMVGRSKPKGYTDPPSYKLVDPGEVLIVGPGISSDDMRTVVERVAADVGKLRINDFYDTTAPDATHDNLGPQPNGQRIFYRSDHYSFAKMGIPVAFYTTGLHPDYHRVTDTADKIDYPSMQVIAKNVAAAGWVLANQAARPRLKATLPAQLVNDMKAAQAQGWGTLTPVLPPLPVTPY